MTEIQRGTNRGVRSERLKKARKGMERLEKAESEGEKAV